MEKTQHKKSAKDDRQRLTRLGDEGLNGRMISEIDEYLVDPILERMCAMHAGGKVQGWSLSPTIKGRYLAALKSVLIQCKRWGWLVNVPAMPEMFPDNARERFFSHDEGEALVRSLSTHLWKMAEFSLESRLTVCERCQYAMGFDLPL